MARRRGLSARAIHLRFTGWMVVDLQNQVGAGLEQLGDAIRHARRRRSRRPTAQAARRQESGRAEAGIALAGVTLASCPSDVLEEQDMVHDFGIAGPQIERAHPRVVRRGGGDDETSVKIGPFGGDLKILPHLAFPIGFSELPSLGKRRRNRGY